MASHRATSSRNCKIRRHSRFALVFAHAIFRVRNQNDGGFGSRSPGIAFCSDYISLIILRYESALLSAVFNVRCRLFGFHSTKRFAFPARMVWTGSPSSPVSGVNELQSAASSRRPEPCEKRRYGNLPANKRNDSFAVLSGRFF